MQNKNHAFAAARVMLFLSGFLTAVLLIFIVLSDAPMAQAKTPSPAVSKLMSGFGTFYSMQRPNYPPLPYNPFPESQTYTLSNGVYMFDDLSVDYEAIDEFSSMMMSAGFSTMGESSAEYGPEGAGYSTNDLWIEILAMTNQNAYLLLHGTVDTDYYQILSKTNLNQPGDWKPGEIRVGDYQTNVTYFNPVFVGNNTNMFFKAHRAPGYLQVGPDGTAYEPNVVYPSGQSANFQIYQYGTVATAYYQMSGVAQNGVDYTNLSGAVTITGGLTPVPLLPKPDNLIEGVETVKMTLLPNDNYLIQDNGDSAELEIRDSSVTVYVTQGTVSDAIEPDGPPGSSAQTGSFTFYRTDDLLLYPAQTVLYSVSGSAVGGTDYPAFSGSITFADGVGSTNLYCTPTSDAAVEGDETVVVTLIPTNTFAILSGYASATNTILDTTTTVSVSSGANAIEPHPGINIPSQTGVFTVSRDDTRFLSLDLPILYQMSGVAVNGTDYTNLSGVVTIPAGQTSTSFFIEPLSENQVEGNESVILTLIPSGDSYLISSTTASATNRILDTATTVSISGFTNATEPNPASSTSTKVGSFKISRSVSQGLVLPALTVSYQLTGTAQNGVDYTNLNTTVIIPTNQTITTVFVQPLYDNVIEPDETVTLTIIPTSDAYLINSNTASATVLILDNVATNMFIRVVTNLVNPVGIDYHQPSNSLIVSYNYDTNGQPNFARIYTNMVSSNIVTVVTNWSGVHDVSGEVKLVTVKTTANGFTNGDIYFGSGVNIGWISADGTKSNTAWASVTNSGGGLNTLPFRGGFYIDQTGLFSNQLVVVPSVDEGLAGDKGVWRVDAQKNSVLITNINTTHLEGIITLPNNSAKWGPWAGKIITGNERNHVIFTIATNGAIAQFDLGIRPEDFDIIPTNQDFYGCELGASLVVKLSRNFLTNYVGDLIITDSGELGGPAKLMIVSGWDSATTNFITQTIQYKHPDGSDGFLSIQLLRRLACHL